MVDVVAGWACHVGLTEVSRCINCPNVAGEDGQEKELKPMWPDCSAKQDQTDSDNSCPVHAAVCRVWCRGFVCLKRLGI